MDPSQAVYFGNLAEAHRGLGQIDQAIEGYAQAARLAPYVAELHNNLGALLEQSGRLEEAQASLLRALECDPGYPDAHYNLGNLFQVRRQWDRAIDCYRQALSLRGDYVEAQCNLGNALRERGELDEALRWLESAVRLSPDSVPAISNLGVVLQELGRLDEALRYCRRAVELAPGRGVLHVNLGTVYKDLGDPAAAIACCQRALAIDSHDPQALFSRGTARLALGDFGGWADCEQRVRCEQFDTRHFSQPQWDGSPLGQRTLLVHSEQGLGDTLQFVRYVRLAAERGGRVVLAPQGALVPLLRASGVPNVLAQDEPLPPFEVHAPLLSLPLIFGTELASIPADVPYLAADERRVEQWRAILDAHPGLKVGIVWQGRRSYRRDRLRSVPLSEFAPLADVPGVQLFSLQKGPGSEQLTESLAARLHIVDLAGSLDNEGSAFMDTAAVMKCLDLVITTDTAAAHLAGALAVPVWVALGFSPEWRWMLDREDSPWYPTMRLFRQAKLGQWGDVFARMADELRKKAVGDRS
jgi:tetratricopeptide (TPR) repeat protein